MQAYKAELAHFGISKAASFGHAYIGKYFKLLCTTNLHLIQTLIVRAANFSGFFACQFPEQEAYT